MLELAHRWQLLFAIGSVVQVEAVWPIAGSAEGSTVIGCMALSDPMGGQEAHVSAGLNQQKYSQTIALIPACHSKEIPRCFIRKNGKPEEVSMHCYLGLHSP